MTKQHCQGCPYFFGDAWCEADPTEIVPITEILTCEINTEDKYEVS